MTNAFGNVIKKSTGPKKASTRVNAQVNDEVRNAVDIVIADKAEIKRLEQEQKDKETVIIDHVRPQQDKLARSDQFTKSLDVAGNKGSLLYTTTDRFSVPQDDDSLDALKKLTGKKFDDMFETVQTLSLKKEVVKNEKLLDKIAKICKKAGLPVEDIFEGGEKIVAKTDLDRRQYDLTEKELNQFRTLVRQNKPGLKY